MQIKKQFEEIYAILEANKNRKVSTILGELTELMSKKSAGGVDGKTFYKDDKGNLIAIFCYYHKKWEPIANVEYGKKTNTATGLNTMCKEGVSQWGKQQRAKKKAEDELLAKVVSGELDAKDIPNEQARLAEEAKVIVDRADGIGFDTIDELLDWLES